MYAPNSRKLTELQQTLNKTNRAHTVCAQQQADILLHKCTHSHEATNNFSFSILVIHLKCFSFNYLRTMLNVKSVDSGVAVGEVEVFFQLLLFGIAFQLNNSERLEKKNGETKWFLWM